jgi:hypothetical protein
MGPIRILIGVAMFAALAVNPAAAQAPLNIVSAAKSKPATSKTTAKKPRKAAVAPKARAQAVAKKPAKARTVTRRGVAPRNAFAQSDSGVIRGPDTIALIAMLPWWRNDRMQSIEYGGEAANSKVMAVADSWLVQHGSSLEEALVDSPTIAHAEATGTDIADPTAVNAIDLAAGPSHPREQSFIHSLLALLGGAIAAAAAGRFLFV